MYKMTIYRIAKNGSTKTETRNCSREVIESVLKDIKAHAPKTPAYVCVDIVKGKHLVCTYDSRTGLIIDMED